MRQIDYDECLNNLKEEIPVFKIIKDWDNYIHSVKKGDYYCNGYVIRNNKIIDQFHGLGCSYLKFVGVILIKAEMSFCNRYIVDDKLLLEKIKSLIK